MIGEAIDGNGDGALDYYLRINPLGARGDLRGPPLRALRLRPDDRRPRCPDRRRGQELVADRDGGLEHGRDQPVDPRHPAGARRPARRASELPGAWPGFRATRRFRGTTYEIEVSRATAAGLGRGSAATTLVVDGAPDRRDRGPAPTDGHAASAGRGRAPVTLADDAASEPVAGDFHGHPTVRLTTRADRGRGAGELRASDRRPARTGGPNLLAETPDVGWETPYGRYELVRRPSAVVLAGGSRPGRDARLRRADRRAAPRRAAAHRRHRARDGLRPVDRGSLDPGCPRGRRPPRARERAARSRSSWPRGPSPSCRSAGGRWCPSGAPSSGTTARPNRNLVLWPYTSWDDPRLRVRDGLVTWWTRPAPELKVGCFADAGWVAYARDGIGARAPLRARRRRGAPGPRLQRGDVLRVALPGARDPGPTARPRAGRGRDAASSAGRS